MPVIPAQSPRPRTNQVIDQIIARNQPSTLSLHLVGGFGCRIVGQLRRAESRRIWCAGGTDDSSANRLPPATTTSENRRCCLSNKRISETPDVFRGHGFSGVFRGHVNIRFSGDTLTFWQSRGPWLSSTLSWPENPSDESPQPLYENLATQRPTSARVAPQVSQWLFRNRTAQKASPAPWTIASIGATQEFRLHADAA